MSEDAGKKKIVFKKKASSAKPVIKLNKPAVKEEATDEEIPATEQLSVKPAAPEAKPAPAPVAPAPAPVAEKKEEPPFKFYCVYCGQKLSAASAMVGKTISCPACKHKIQVPTPP